MKVNPIYLYLGNLPHECKYVMLFYKTKVANMTVYTKTNKTAHIRGKLVVVVPNKLHKTIYLLRTN